MKKIFSLAVIAAVISTILPVAVMTASASLIESNIYASDFETMPTHAYTGTGSNDQYAVKGGWRIYTNAGLADGKGGGNSLCVASAPNKQATTASAGCYYILPPEKRMKTGIYVVNFDFNAGASAAGFGIYFHDEANTSGKGAVVNSVGKSTLEQRSGYEVLGSAVIGGGWYNADVTIDLDNRTYTTRVLKPDGTVYKGWGTDLVYSGETLSLIEFVSLSTTNVSAGNNTDTSAPYGLRIDNLSIRHYDGSLIYSNDFEAQDRKPQYNKDQQEAGGITNETTSAFVSGGYNGSSYAYSFIHADGMSYSGSGTNYGEFHIPQVHKHSTGIYKVVFCLMPGSKSTALKFPFAAHNTYNKDDLQDTGTITVDGTNVKTGNWYRTELTINLDEGNYDLSLYDLEASGYPRVYNSTGSTSKKFKYIGLYDTTTASGTIASGEGPRMDNLEVHYYKYGRAVGETFDGGYLYNTYTTGTKLGSGKWALSGSAEFVMGGINGSAYAFCPAFKAGTTGNSGSTEYYLPIEEVSSMGQYRLSFWFRKSSISKAYIYATGRDEYGLSYATNLSTLSGIDGTTDGNWYHADAVIDVDLHRYNIRFHDTEGNLIEQREGNYSGDQRDRVTCFSWRCDSRSGTITSDNCWLIDDVYITHNSASVDETRAGATQGISFGGDSVTYSASVFNDLFESDNSSNTKHYKTLLGVYDGDNLVCFDQSAESDCATNNAATASGTVLYTNLPNGTGNGYTYRMFLWNTGANSTEIEAFGKVLEATK